MCIVCLFILCVCVCGDHAAENIVKSCLLERPFQRRFSRRAPPLRIFSQNTQAGGRVQENTAGGIPFRRSCVRAKDFYTQEIVTRGSVLELKFLN